MRHDRTANLTTIQVRPPVLEALLTMARADSVGPSPDSRAIIPPTPETRARSARFTRQPTRPYPAPLPEIRTSYDDDEEAPAPTPTSMVTRACLAAPEPPPTVRMTRPTLMAPEPPPTVVMAHPELAAPMYPQLTHTQLLGPTQVRLLAAQHGNRTSAPGAWINPAMAASKRPRPAPATGWWKALEG